MTARRLLSVPGIRRLLLGSVLGRLPSGMYSLAILLFVHARTGSFFSAGLAVGAFTLVGAATGPMLGALVDRVGQTSVLLAAAGGQAALLSAFGLLVQAGTPTAEIIALAAMAGACQPPIAGCVRALWPVAAGEDEALETAYALDATTQELIWTLGPLLVGFAVSLLSPVAGVLACAAITACGTVFFASSRLSRDWRPSTPRSERGSALASGELRALLVTVLLAGIVIGAVEVGLPALANEHRAHWSAGPLLALFSIGSMTGGLLYSARSWQGAVARRYSALLLAMAATVAPLAFVHSLPPAFLLSILAGLGLAPMLTAQLSLVGALASADRTTEAFTWHRTATIAGAAIGSALGGSLIDAYGASTAFALGCAGVTLAWLLAELWQRRTKLQTRPYTAAS